MKNCLIIILFILSAGLSAQNSPDPLEIKVGDTFEIGFTETSNYQHISFPRPNFIIKRGGIANYKSVVGKTVKVTALEENNEGQVQITIERADGMKFFRTHKKVTANFIKSLESGELLVIE